MRIGYGVRKASRVKTGLIQEHVNPTRRAVTELLHKKIETYQNNEFPQIPFLLPNPHQAITVFNYLGGEYKTRTNHWPEEIEDLPYQTKIRPKGRILIPQHQAYDTPLP